MGLEELCLSWDEHHKTLIGVFEKLLERSSLVDCTIAAEGQYLKAHKVVLSACSPYFEMLFTQENEKNPIVVLKDIKFQDLKALIDFIYRGKVQIPGERLGDFTSAAESLQIKGLGGGHKRNISERVEQESSSLYIKDDNDSPSHKRMRPTLSEVLVKNIDVALPSVKNKSQVCEGIPDLPSCSKSIGASTFEKAFTAPTHSVRTHEESSEKISFPDRQVDCASETVLEPISEVLLPESECLVEPKNEVCIEEVSILGSDDEIDDGGLQGWNNEESNNSVYSSSHGSMKEVSDNAFSVTLLAEQSNTDIFKEAEYAESKLPEKSKHVYEREYGNFCRWRSDRGMSGVSEEMVLSYFNSKSSTHKSLWSYYSMLRATLRVKENVDISKYSKLIIFLKRQGEGHIPKKSKTFSKLEFYKFLKEACDEEFLLMKVVMIMGVAGGCRLDELYKMSVDDVQDRDSVFVVKIPDTRANKDRLFTIVEEENGVELLRIVRKYISLRPPVTIHKHFFVSYRNQKCTVQPVGKNSFGKMPMMIAKFLKLPNPDLYTGHCFRRSSASFLSTSGADFVTLKSIWGI